MPALLRQYPHQGAEITARVAEDGALGRIAAPADGHERQPERRAGGKQGDVVRTGHVGELGVGIGRQAAGNAFLPAPPQAAHCAPGALAALHFAQHRAGPLAAVAGFGHVKRATRVEDQAAGIVEVLITTVAVCAMACCAGSTSASRPSAGSASMIRAFIGASGVRGKAGNRRRRPSSLGDSARTRGAHGDSR